MSTTTWTRSGDLTTPGSGPVRRTVPRARLSAARPHGSVLLQVLLATAPAMTLLWMDRPFLAAACLYTALAVLLVRNHLFGQRMANLALLVGVLPALMLLRDFVFFHSVTLLFGLMAGGVMLQSRTYASVLRRSGIGVFLFLGLCYWLISFLLTAEYHHNLRILELIFSASAIVLLAQRPRYLATALLGVLGSTTVMGMAMFAEGTRLGIASAGNVSLGNPITFGSPLALLLLLLTAERGRWLGLEQRGSMRAALTMLVGTLLLLSTSRGSWLVAIMGLAVITVLDRTGRRAVIVTGLALSVGAAAALYSGRGASLEAAFEQTFSNDRSLLNRTSGRSEQWMLFPEVIAQSPIWGFGPGFSRDVYAEASLADARVRGRAGVRMQWHSLYLHLGVETGAVGGVVLLLLAGRLLIRNLTDLRRYRSLVPLVGTIGYLMIGLTVIGMDAVSGLHLGFGLLTGAALTHRRVAGNRNALQGTSLEGAGA